MNFRLLHSNIQQQQQKTVRQSSERKECDPRISYAAWLSSFKYKRNRNIVKQAKSQGIQFLSGRKPCRTTFCQLREDGEFGEVHSLDMSKHKGPGRLPLPQLVLNSGQQWREKLVRGITKVGRPWHGRWSKLPGPGYPGKVASRNHREGDWQEVPSGHPLLRQADHTSWTPDLAVETRRREHSGTPEISRYQTARLQH